MERGQVGDVSVLLTEIDQGVDEPGDSIVIATASTESP